jgi:hypothetical protein
VATGLLPLLGYALDPYSILVPFLVFAIGMSHGAQKMNGIMQDVGRGAHKLVAARFTFRRLFLAGLTALLADAVGFAVLLVIDIQVIRELAIAASIGVAVLIFTNLILLPVLLSYTGVSAPRRRPQPARRTGRRRGAAKHRAVGLPRPLHAPALGCRGRDRRPGHGLWEVSRPARGCRSATWTPARPSCVPTAATTATWPSSTRPTAPQATCWR